MSRDETLRRFVRELQRLGYGEPKRQPVEWGVLCIHPDDVALQQSTNGMQGAGTIYLPARMVLMTSRRRIVPALGEGSFEGVYEAELMATARACCIEYLHSIGWELHSGDVFVRYEDEGGA